MDYQVQEHNISLYVSAICDKFITREKSDKSLNLDVNINKWQLDHPNKNYII